MRWNKVTMDELCVMNSGGTPRRGTNDYYGGNIPWVKISDIEAAKGGIVVSTEEYITKEGLQAIGGRIFPKGTLLLAMYGSVGKIAFAGTELSTNQAILGIRNKHDSQLNMRYLKFWFESIKQSLLHRAVGGTLQNISLGIVKKLEVPLPPLHIQQQIADTLDKADALRQKDQQLLQKYEQLIHSIFYEMFGDPVENKKGFHIFPLSEVCDEVFLGLTNKVEYVESGGYPLVRARDILNGKLSFERAKYISEKQHLLITKNRITKRGDVLVSKSGTLGTCAIVETDQPFTTYESIITLRPCKNVLVNSYLLFLLRNENMKQKMLGDEVGGVVGHLNLQGFRKIKIPVPNFKIQNQFASIVKSWSSQLRKVQLTLSNSENLFSYVLNSTFYN